jgi:hypothetical protein
MENFGMVREKREGKCSEEVECLGLRARLRLDSGTGNKNGEERNIW